MLTTWIDRCPWLVRAAALIAPAPVGLTLHLLRGEVDQPAAVLVLVLVVVGAAATGDRLAGLLAALSSAAVFDFYFTAPFLSFAIHGRDDLELAALLVLVGVAVTELALWGHRQHARALRQAGYIDGILDSTDAATLAANPGQGVADAVSRQLRTVLGVDRCTFVGSAPDGGAAVVQRDGRVTVNDRVVDVARAGLPVDRVTAVPVECPGQRLGHLAVIAATRTVWPTRDQLRVAVLLADQLALRIRPGVRRAEPAEPPRVGTAPGCAR